MSKRTLVAATVCGAVAGVLWLGNPQRSASAAVMREWTRGAHWIGAPDATVVVLIFSDPLCSHCRDLAAMVDSVRRLAPDAAFAVRHVLVSPSEQGIARAAVLECAARAGRFPSAFRAFGQNQLPNSDMTAAADFASLLGISPRSFLDCLQSPDARATIASHQALAAGIGVRSTPTLVINGTTVIGKPAFKTLLQLIDAARADTAHKLQFRRR